MNKSELKPYPLLRPCPYCGCMPELVTEYFLTRANRYTVKCGFYECVRDMRPCPTGDNLKDVVATWNTRAENKEEEDDRPL